MSDSPDRATTPPSPVLGDLRRAFQIGMVVRDLEHTLAEIERVLGLRPFRVVTYPPADRGDMDLLYRGQPGHFVYRQAFVDLGSVELEIIQPLSGESIWADFLREHGEGIHHIRFNTFDMPTVVKHMAQHGAGVTMSGKGLRPGTCWANFDTEKLFGFTLEMMQALPGTDGRTPAES
jgi:methylmalonyl-CoA/ethylmalonyl-CoA epimerase